MQVFRAYTFDAHENSFNFVTLRSDWTRFQTQMTWRLMNGFTLAGWPCFASDASIAKTYQNVSGVAATSTTRKQADAKVRRTDAYHRSSSLIIFIHHTTVAKEEKITQLNLN